MFGTRAKQYPNLVEYLTVRIRPRAPLPNLTGPVLMGLSGPLVALGPQLGTGLSVPWAASGLVALIIMGMAFVWGVKVVRTTPKLHRSPIQEAADDVVDRLRTSMLNRRLHLDLHDSLAILLDEACVQYKRAHALLEGPFWDSIPLTPHWETLRVQLRTAMESAMDEALVLVGSDLGSGPPRHAAQALVEDVIQSFVNPRSDDLDPRLPPSFGPLRELTMKMQDLCGQVEQATQRVRDRHDAPATASRQIDDILSELRQMDVAEEELRRDQRA